MNAQIGKDENNKFNLHKLQTEIGNAWQISLLKMG